MENEAKKMICEIGKRIYNRNYVAANDGNISVKVAPDIIIATPTGVSKGYMEPDMLVKISPDGKILEGKHAPSSEIKMHLRVYAENPKAQAVVHAHPPVATAFSIAGIPLDLPILSEAVVTLGVVPIAPYATTGSDQVAESIAPYCKTHNAVLLANHGALTWGEDLMQAYLRMESLEHYALVMMYTTGIIKQYNTLTDTQINELVAIRENAGIKTGGKPSN